MYFQIYRRNHLIRNNAAIRKKELFTSWKKEIDVQAKSYADSLHTTFGTMKAEVNHQISKFNEMKTQLQENMRLQEYASSQLKDAEAAIHLVLSAMKINVKKHCNMLLKHCNPKIISLLEICSIFLQFHYLHNKIVSRYISTKNQILSNSICCSVMFC